MQSDVCAGVVVDGGVEGRWDEWGCDEVWADLASLGHSEGD